MTPSSEQSKSVAAKVNDTTKITGRAGLRVGRWNLRAQLQRKWADVWVGVYIAPDESMGSGTAWICVVPCFPVKVDWWRSF